MSKDIDDLNIMITQLDLTDTYRILHQTDQCTLSLSTHGIFFRTNCTLDKHITRQTYHKNRKLQTSLMNTGVDIYYKILENRKQ